MQINLLLLTSKYLSYLSSFIVVGFLLAFTFLLINKEGSLQEVSLKLRQRASIFALFWFLSSTVFLITTFANILDTTFVDALDVGVGMRRAHEHGVRHVV